MLLSSFKQLIPVSLPYAGRQYYMHGFDLSKPTVPKGFEDYLQTVKELCEAAGAYIGKAFLTVDEKVIPAGMSQRKPGPHVDGCFMEHMNSWGGGGSGWSASPTPGWVATPSWNHTCNAVPFARMPVIVASDVALCKAWEGVFDATPTSGHPTLFDGDLSHVELGEGTILPANVGYLLSPDCIHESMKVDVDTRRTFIRIALPTTFDYQESYK